MVAASRDKVVRLGVLAAILAVSVSCASEKTVYRDVSGPTPPAAAGNFVGYAQNSTKQTVCGNCHVDLQTAWVQTGHASAWQNLMASGHAGDACKDCHTVSANGNGDTVAVGYTATKDPRYQDVQCESCHGAGLSHATTPSIANRPLASIAVSTDSGSKFGCAGCHTGTHEPFVDQWKISAHNYVAAAPEEERSQGCGNCHVGQDAITKFGVNTNYQEKASTTVQPITCVVCHDPHSKKNDKQLRFAVATRDTAQNLCMKCHNRNNFPTSWGSARSTISHAPETGTLLGYAGWFPPGMTPPSQGGAIVGTHGSAANTKMCATCHVSRMAVNDSANNLIFQATGHTFNAIPCLDSKGRPLAGASCDYSQASFASCTASGCHGSQDAARNALVTAKTRIKGLVDELAGMLAQVPDSEKTVLKFTVARGAMFNLSMVHGGHNGEVSERLEVDSLNGPVAHNPFLLEQLLTNTIKAMQTQYPYVTASKGLVLDNVLKH